MDLEDFAPNLNSKHSSEHRHNLSWVVKRVDTVFLLLLIVSPVAVLLSRLVTKWLPIEKVLIRFTTYSPEKINSESLRILTEGADYASFILVLTFLALFTIGLLIDLRRKVRQPHPLPDQSRQKSSKIVLICTLLIMGLHFATVHPWRTDAFGERFLDGFGFGPVVFAIGAAILINYLQDNDVVPENFMNGAKAKAISAVCGIALLFPQLIVIGRQIGNNREYLIVYNEYAAASVGLQPLNHFASTYSSLIGFIVKPFIYFANPEQSFIVLIFFHIGITFILVIAIVTLIWQNLRVHWSIALLFFAILISPRQQNAYAQGFLPSVSAPSRYLFPIILFILLNKYFRKTSPPIRLVLFIGMAWGLASVNNAEIGLPLTISILGALVLKVVLDRNFFRNFLFPVLVLTATFVLLMYVLGGNDILWAIHKWSLFLVGRSQGGFVGAVPVFGLHQYALALHGSTLLISVLAISTIGRLKKRTNLESRSLMGFCLGSFGLLTHPYFLGQNGPNFIGGFLWLPLVLSVSVLVGLIREVSSYELFNKPIGSKIKLNFTNPINLGLVVLFVCCALFVPNPQDMVGIHFDDEYEALESVDFDEDPMIVDLRTAVGNEPDKSNVAYYGEYGNLISAMYGIRSVYGTHDPMIAYSSRRTIDATCEPLKFFQPDIIFASKRFLPTEFLESKNTSGPCPGLVKDVGFLSKQIIRYTYQTP